MPAFWRLADTRSCSVSPTKHFPADPLGPDQTRWKTNNEFRCKGFIKIMAFLMPGMFKKQSFKYLEMFKAFAEKEGT